MPSPNVKKKKMHTQSFKIFVLNGNVNYFIFVLKEIHLITPGFFMIHKKEGGFSRSDLMLLRVSHSGGMIPGKR